MIHIPRRALIDALTLIALGGCENNTGGRRCWDDPERIRGGHYTSGAWCTACIAQDALGRPEPEPAAQVAADLAAAATMPPPGWTGYCAMHKVKHAPACRHQCPTCRIHDRDLEIQRIAEAEVTKLGRPGDQW